MKTRFDRRKALEEELRREADKAARAARRAVVADDGLPSDALALKDALKNIGRTATRGLDEAGVPDRFQGAGQEEWDDE